MLDEDPYIAKLRKTFAVAMAYVQDRATIVPHDIIRKRYMRHCPEKTKSHMLCWGRDYWYRMDMLPKKYRELINDEPNNPTEALGVCEDLWKEEMRIGMAAITDIGIMIRSMRNDSGMLWMRTTGALVSKWIGEAPIDEANIMNALIEEYITLTDRIEYEEKALRAKNAARMSHQEASGRRYVRRFATDTYAVRENNIIKPIENYEYAARNKKKNLPPHLQPQIVKTTRVGGGYFVDTPKPTQAEINAKIDNTAPLRSTPSTCDVGVMHSNPVGVGYAPPTLPPMGI